MTSYVENTILSRISYGRGRALDCWAGPRAWSGLADPAVFEI